MRKEVRVGLIGSMAMVAGLAGVLTFATAAGAKPHPTTTTTTTTSTTTTTTTVPPTTTTTVPCNAVPATATAGAATMTVTPGTCLNGGSVVGITGSGFDPSADGLVLQCSNAAGQPQVPLVVAGHSETLDVSCTPLLIAHLIITTSTGAIPAGKTFTVIDGTTGPPCGAGSLAPTCPPDTGGTGSATADAANYPCPPTPAQLAAGAQCTLSFGDSGPASAAVTVPISFTPAAVAGGGGTTTTTTAPATAASTSGSTPAAAAAAAAPTTAAASGSLAFTGPGTGLYIVGAAGLIMVLLGAAILGLSGAPGSLVLAMRRRRRSS
jgi:hypothetical protein